MRWCHPFLRDAVGIRCLGGAQQTVVSWSSFPWWADSFLVTYVGEKLLESDCVLPEWGIALSLKSMSYWPAWANAHFPASLDKTQALTPFCRLALPSLPILASISDYVWVSTDQRQQAILWKLCAIPRAEKWRNMDFRHLVWWRLETEDKRNARLRKMGLLRKNKEQMTSM